MKEFNRMYPCRVVDGDTLRVSAFDDGDNQIRIGCTSGRRTESLVCLNKTQVTNLIELLTEGRDSMPDEGSLWEDT